MAEITSETIENGIKIITYADGSQHFEPIEQKKKNDDADNRSWWQKLKDWWNNADIKPYVKVRDLADPFGDRKNNPDDIDVGSDGATGIEAGIKISF